MSNQRHTGHWKSGKARRRMAVVVHRACRFLFHRSLRGLGILAAEGAIDIPDVGSTLLPIGYHSMRVRAGQSGYPCAGRLDKTSTARQSHSPNCTRCWVTTFLDPTAQHTSLNYYVLSTNLESANAHSLATSKESQLLQTRTQLSPSRLPSSCFSSLVTNLSRNCDT